MGHFEAKLGQRVTFRANICEPSNEGIVMLYYNFAAKSFYIKKLCSRLYSIGVKFY